MDLENIITEIVRWKRKAESGEIITLNQAIDLIRKSVDDEKEDEMFYGILIEQAPTDKEKDIIEKHMWPVTVAFPKSIEGFILTFVDKYCALSESFEILKSRLFMKKAFRYAYLAFSLVIIKI